MARRRPGGDVEFCTYTDFSVVPLSPVLTSLSSTTWPSWFSTLETIFFQGKGLRERPVSVFHSAVGGITSGAAVSLAVVYLCMGGVALS